MPERRKSAPPYPAHGAVPRSPGRGLAGPDATRRTSGLPLTRPGCPAPPGLGPSPRHRLSLESADVAELGPFGKRVPARRERSATPDGELPMRIGVPPPVPQAALLIGCLAEPADDTDGARGYDRGAAIAEPGRQEDPAR